MLDNKAIGNPAQETPDKDDFKAENVQGRGKIKFHINGLIIANQPTEGGNFYTLESVKLVERQIITSKNKVTVQEMNVPERIRDKIPPHEPIMSRTMAVITGAKVNGNSLDVECETRLTRDGKKLTGILESLGVESLNFIPVGIGETRASGKYKEVFNYSLKYITIEPA